MELNDKQLELLERLGKTFFDLEACAKALEVAEIDLVQMMQDVNSKAYKAYNRGYLSAELKHRESIMALSERGSSPAQAMVQKFIDASKNSF